MGKFVLIVKIAFLADYIFYVFFADVKKNVLLCKINRVFTTLVSLIATNVNKFAL